MAALKTGCARDLAINAPILVILVSVYVYEAKECNKTYFKCNTMIFSDHNIKNNNFKVK